MTDGLKCDPIWGYGIECKRCKQTILPGYVSEDKLVQKKHEQDLWDYMASLPCKGDLTAWEGKS